MPRYGCRGRRRRRRRPLQGLGRVVRVACEQRSSSAAALPCTEFVATQGSGSVRHEEIVAAVKPAARAKVPDHLKAELLKRLRDVLEG